MMTINSEFHVITVGWEHQLVDQLVNPIAAKSVHRYSHIVHPKYTPENWPQLPPQQGIHFFRDRIDQPMPQSDRQLLASLERDDVPTLHNMILGDRIVCKLEYEDALRYATFLAQRLADLFKEIKPGVVILGFDAIHTSIALAVSKRMNIPAFALNFSVIPQGLACFCDRMSPAARVLIKERPQDELLSLADTSLTKFEDGQIDAPAYIEPTPGSVFKQIFKFPRRLAAVFRTIRKSRQGEWLQYTEDDTDYRLWSALAHLGRKALARRAILSFKVLESPPDTPFALFGFHMQPESSIDVWAPFYSNQKWVIELLSRSIPPSFKLLIKIHKSDVAKFSRSDLQQMCQLPGVELVAPFADTRRFIEKSALLMAIQGTMGLEAALMGKPVIMLGESPVTLLPSAERAASLAELPSLVRKMLRQPPPSRTEILNGYAAFLAPFFSASYNDWNAIRTDEEISDYVAMFDALEAFVSKSKTVRLPDRQANVNP